MVARKWAPVLVGAAVLAAGCHQDMWNQPKAKAQSKNDELFDNRSNSRLPVAGTVAFGQNRSDNEFYTGFDKQGHLIKEFPIAVNEAVLKRGQERFQIFCTPCHGELGNGKGMIASRGFTLARPVGNYHSQRLRAMPVGHFFDVITNGYSTMYPFKSRIKPYDRWAIVSYIRVLQESGYTPISDIPGDERAKLEALPRDPSQDAKPELPVRPLVKGAPDMGSADGAVTVPIGRRDDRTQPNGSSSATTAGAPSGAGAAQPGGNH